MNILIVSIVIAIVVVIIVTTVLLIVFLRKKPKNGCPQTCPDGQVCQNGACVSSGCNPACKSGYSCQNNQCIPVLPCESDESCPEHQYCENPGQPNSFCLACRDATDCLWNTNAQICMNQGTIQSKCVQCMANTDCTDPTKVCEAHNCIPPTNPGWLCSTDNTNWSACSNDSPWPYNCNAQNNFTRSVTCQDNSYIIPDSFCTTQKPIDTLPCAYDCDPDTHDCIQSPNGQYSTLNDCGSNCIL